MRQSEVPIYTDPDSFDNVDAKYPCSTQYMTYNARLHRYELTIAGLQHYGVDVERRYVSSSSDKWAEIIRLSSKKIYDYIQYKAGQTRYQIMLYRIAAAPANIYHDQYYMRKQFEEALVDQARYLVANSNLAEFSTVNLESEFPQPIMRPDDVMRDVRDISPEALRTLEALNLTGWFNASGAMKPDLNKY